MVAPTIYLTATNQTLTGALDQIRQSVGYFYIRIEATVLDFGFYLLRFISEYDLDNR